jgi:galactokinase
MWRGSGDASASHDWIHYVQAALKGGDRPCACRHTALPPKLHPTTHPSPNAPTAGVQGLLTARGASKRDWSLAMLVQGSVPNSAGLSSSSALVVASALALGWAAGLHLSRAELADMCTAAERFVCLCARSDSQQHS